MPAATSTSKVRLAGWLVVIAIIGMIAIALARTGSAKRTAPER